MGSQPIKHTDLKRLIDASKKLNNMSLLEPVVASNNAFVLTSDGRLAFRFQLGDTPVADYRGETTELGLDHKGITVKEAYAFISRFAALPQIEEAAIQLQRDRHRLIDALRDLLNGLQKHDQRPEAARIVKAAMVLRDME